MPLNQIMRMPKDQKWRSVNTGGAFLKQVSSLNDEALDTFLKSIGFKKLADKSYKFMKEEEGEANTGKTSLI